MTVWVLCQQANRARSVSEGSRDFAADVSAGTLPTEQERAA